MKVVREFEEKVPTWALCYFVNADDSGLTEEDKQQANRFWDKYQRKADMFHCLVTFNVPDDIDADKYFCSSPAFGSPCDVVDCMFVFLA